jgi:hypothetical protein
MATEAVRRPRRDLAGWIMPAGIILTLSGLIGDLISHAAAPAAHANEGLITFGAGFNPWHFVLFGGILVSAAGGIVNVSRMRTEGGAVLGAVMVVLVLAAVAVGGWTAARNGSTAGPDVAAGTGAAHVHSAGSGSGAGAGTSHSHSHSDAGVTTGEGSEGASHVHGKAKPLTPAQKIVVDRQLAAAKRATAKYRDIEVAKADGYFQVTQFIPGLGLHMVNLKIDNTVFDPAKPNLLLYQPTPSGGLKLAGVAYQIAHVDDTPPAGFAGGSDVWHFHTNLCFLPGGTVTITETEADCKAGNGFFQAQTAWLLHAWVWVKNPSGVFTEYNPRVS